MRIWMVIAAMVCATWFAQAKAGDEPACPHTRASQVNAFTYDLGPSRRCGVGLYLFGFGGAILGELCPAFRMFHPAHQVCLGEHADDMRCEPEGPLEVKRKSCSCGGLVIPVIDTGVPTSCVCDNETAAGTVEDFRTVLC
jgi:hypothetical protein